MYGGLSGMYQIDSKYDQPDIKYMYQQAVDNMEAGIAIRDINNLYKKLYGSKQSAAKNLHSMYGIENPNSYKQILAYLESMLNDDIVDACCREGKWTTDKQAMRELALKGYQEAIDILTYRKAEAFVKGLNLIKDNMYVDGMVHPQVSLGKTNRLNYTNPALMNIPKKLLWHIIAPRKTGNILLSADIKNQEPWIMINVLDIKVLKVILEENPMGLYEAVFYHIFDRECTPIERDELKIAWNAMTYGATMYGINAICRHCDGAKIYKFFNSIPEFKKYRGLAFGRAKKKTQEVKTYFGTTVRANEFGPKLVRVLMDIPIQGTGADLLALLVKHANDEFEDRELEDKISLYFTRHDELIFEAEKEYIDEVGVDGACEVLNEILEHRVDDWEPFQVKISELKPAELFIDGAAYEEDEDD